MNARFWVAFAAASIVTLIVSGASLMVGATHLTPGAFVESLFDYDPARDEHLVARDIRLPRAVLALVVGASLAVAGAVMQGVTRNPLAGPSIMGLSGGGSLASLVALAAVPGLSYNGSIAASLLGAALGYGSVLAVASLSPGGFSPTRLALAGVMVSALFSALTQTLVIVLDMSKDTLYWTLGGIANVSWSQVAAVLPFSVAGLAGAVWISPAVTALSLGNDVAVGLGQRPPRVRVAATACVLLLTGASVAVAGPVGFVGLMVPHGCRALVGSDYRRLIPLSAVVGAGLTQLADLGGRIFLGSGAEIPLGVMTAVVGAPFFVGLIRGRARQGMDGGAPRNAAPELRPRPRLALPIMAAVLVLAVLTALHLGHANLSPAAVGRAILGWGDPEVRHILWSFRMPRIAFAVLVGGGIAVAGAVLQGVFRNDLAEPGLLGVSAGANLAMTLTLGTVGHAVLGTTFGMPLVAVGGALATTLLVSTLSLGGSLSAPRLLLTGAAASAALGAVTLLVSLRMGGAAYSYAVAFSAGSLNSADWNYVAVLAGWLGIFVPLVWALAPTLNVLRLGEDVARGLGVPVPAGPLLLLSLAVAVCASSMALAGGVMFVGLIAPHIARRLVGANHDVVIPAAGLIGATLLILADAAGGQILRPAEIPAGVMVSALGAPYFLYLLTRR